MNRDNTEHHSTSLGMNNCTHAQHEEFSKNITKEKDQTVRQETITQSTTAEIADDIIFESTDRELFEITLALYKRMDSTYKSQFLDNI